MSTNVSSEKLNAYEKLVDAVKKDYATRIYPVTNSEGLPVYVGPCPYEGIKQINLWSYWQGDLNAKILVLGQDWGCFRGKTNKELDKAMEENFKQIDNKEAAFYFDGTIEKDRSKTDRNLIKLFKNIGYDIEKPDCKGLFFSNLCLGYRNKGFTGGFKVKWLTDDVKYLIGYEQNGEYIQGLMEIISPSVVICLGKEVYRVVTRAIARKYNDSTYLVNPKTFYKDLEEKKNYKDIPWEDPKIRIYGVAHPGDQGKANRKSQVTKLDEENKKVRIYKDESITGESLQMSDWKCIGNYVKNLV